MARGSRNPLSMSFYRMSRSPSSFPGDIPGTAFLMAANAASFILLFLTLFPLKLYDLLVPTSSTVWHAPWAFFTYPLISRPLDAWKFLSLLFGLWWLYVVGGLLERAWGTRKFLTVFFVFSAISAFFISAGAVFENVEVGFGELICPLVDLTVLWALMEPEAPVVLFVFPMKLKWLAVITCLMLLFQFGNPYPILGFFALGGCAAATLYTRLNRGTPAGSYPTAYTSPKTRGNAIKRFSPFEWYRKWKFKRRFKRLWGD